MSEARRRVATDGLDGLVLREIAAAVGVNHRALYRHFPDKQSLVQHLAADQLERLTRSISRALSKQRASPKPLILMRAYVSYALRHPKLYELIFSLPLVDDFDRDTEVGEQVKRLVTVASSAFRQPGETSMQTRDRVVRAWGAAHGLILLTLRRALRARTRREALRYIVRSALSGTSGITNAALGLTRALADGVPPTSR